MILDIKKIFYLFDAKEKRQVYWLFCAIIMLGLIEIAGVVSIMPFMAVVADPGIVSENYYLAEIYSYLRFTNTNQFLFFLGFIVLIIILVSNSFSALVNWLMLRFSHLRGHSLSEKLLKGYLGQSYVFFLDRNTSELANIIFYEVSRVINGVVMPLMLLVAKLVSTLFILILLMAVNPSLALMVITSLGLAYIVIFFLVRNRLTWLGKKISKVGGERYKLASEALGGIKDLKLLGRELEFTSRFSVPSRNFALYQASSQIITHLPRYALEVVAFGGILLIVMYLLSAEKGVSNVLPLIALYAFAGYRLLPALQQIFVGASSVKNNIPALEVLYNDLKHCDDKSHVIDTAFNNNTYRNPLPFEDKLELKNIVYRYPGVSKAVIEQLDMDISADTTIGIVGGTGSGKTTIIDIILGLLIPESGYLYVDGVSISESNIRNWQMNMGYVPQSIFLTDDTIKNNIAFGVPNNEIDMNAITKAAEIANIHDFIIDQLPEGYETYIGERGVRLSGGQRQRIGIARALYHDPKVLILDEATSALDGVTENAIMDAISKLSHKKTIIMVAHRLTTVKACDLIYIFENGNIVESGTYSQLIETSSRFKNMANVGIQ